MKNRKVVLLRRPGGLPAPDVWDLVYEELPALRAGEVRVRVDCLSLDPAMRVWMNEDSYAGSVELGRGAMWAFGVGWVEESLHPELSEGDAVHGRLGAQDFAVLRGDELQKLSPGEEPLSYHLGIYGLTGMTAYFGITDVGRVTPGQQVLVSAAAGGVGSLAAQIARLRGARVVGIAGGPDKRRRCVEDHGCAACVDYKAEDFAEALVSATPDGVDVFFDNVGVPVLDCALDRLNDHATIVLCGAISQYQNMAAVEGPRNYLKIAERAASLRGFTCGRYRSRFPEAVAQLRAWLESGEIVYTEHREEGLEHFHDTFLKLFSGENRGKLVLSP